jgi:DNA/RNA endonuclease YhcR with UshA esterase domain
LIEASSVKDITILGTLVNIISSPYIDENPPDRDDDEMPSENSEATSNRPAIYEVDDGTGVIRVVHFLQQNLALQSHQGVAKCLKDCEKQGHLSQGLFSLLNKTEKFAERKAISIGTTVEVKGVAQIFRDQTEIKAFKVREVLDAQDEVQRMLVVSELRSQKVYQEDEQK